LGEARYSFSAEEREEAEYDRLRLQESLVDPVTIRHLEAIGVAEGWRCLESARFHLIVLNAGGDNVAYAGWKRVAATTK
jgi:hypothetical protein